MASHRLPFLQLDTDCLMRIVATLLRRAYAPASRRQQKRLAATPTRRERALQTTRAQCRATRTNTARNMTCNYVLRWVHDACAFAREEVRRTHPHPKPHRRLLRHNHPTRHGPMREVAEMLEACPSFRACCGVVAGGVRIRLFVVLAVRRSSSTYYGVCRTVL